VTGAGSSYFRVSKMFDRTPLFFVGLRLVIGAGSDEVTARARTRFVSTRESVVGF
jgi:hypothetical protein